MRGLIFDTIYGNIGLLLVGIYGWITVIWKQKIMCHKFALELEEGVILSIHMFGKRRKSLIYNKKNSSYMCVESDFFDYVGKSIRIYTNGEIAIRVEKDKSRKVGELIICILSVLCAMTFIVNNVRQLELVNLILGLFVFIVVVIYYPFVLRKVMIDNQNDYYKMHKREIEFNKQQLDLQMLEKVQYNMDEVWHDDEMISKNAQAETDKRLIIISLSALIFVGVALTILQHL